ncbi:Hpt domain-containing protein [Pseudomonas brassicacearum]|uniref:Hpt domain-containing protein n=1 Tax=Pseudomonas brassicacearum subsp. neoaurantiaca TaxID=494916 RepID=A0A7V8UC48_9PSED|nr:Hpt domain-containing protein [Pseudomonas brassicacearum]MBA1377604.1 Hpt domain-containing protein [Pseudomonas brassicacearum subsp. neoaurantiaca]
MSEIHLDRDVLSTLREVMEDGYPELLDTFLEDSEARLRVLHEARDAEKLSATAHSFKGSSSNMGALRLAELCGELEQRAKQPSLGGIERLVNEIDSEFAFVRTLCREEREGFHC